VAWAMRIFGLGLFTGAYEVPDRIQQLSMLMNQAGKWENPLSQHNDAYHPSFWLDINDEKSKGRVIPPPVEVNEIWDDAERLIQQTAVQTANSIESWYAMYGMLAFYNVDQDTVYMPPMRNATSSLGYYGAYLHELVHWTGHIKRGLRRLQPDVRQSMHSYQYAEEEAIAEIGSILLLDKLGRLTDKHLSNSAAYIRFWQSHHPASILTDKVALDSMKAVEYILNQTSQREAA
jgi:antirestriction protein ArdC